jgi:ATP-binding protein involved in chromosome partitioning
MELNEQAIREALAAVRYPGFTRDIVAAGVVQDVRVDGTGVQVVLRVEQGQPGESAVPERIRAEAEAVLRALPGVERVEISLAGSSAGSPSLRVVGKKPSAAASGGVDAGLVPGVGQIIAVASGKGGVGKSTVAVNLAVALARQGTRVGLLDADIYGPSIPLMMGLAGAKPSFDPARQRLLPFERYGVRFMSLGFLVDPDSAVIWRGPLVMKAVEQLLRDVEWGELDVLVVDMPPGTGDVQLTLSQRVRLAGAVVVTTPQDVALADAIKGIAMFRKVDVPILGIVENMSFFSCPSCGERTEIFGHGGGRTQAERLGVPFLGEVPLVPGIREHGDSGHPTVDAAPESAQGRAFLDLGAAVHGLLIESSSS